MGGISTGNRTIYKMINFNFLENNIEKLRLEYLLAKPFPYLVIDDFCDPEKLLRLYAQIP